MSHDENFFWVFTGHVKGLVKSFDIFIGLLILLLISSFSSMYILENRLSTDKFTLNSVSMQWIAFS